MAEIITVDVNTFSHTERKKVFYYLCDTVLQRKRYLVKKQLKIKSMEQLTWDHILDLTQRYGLRPGLTFSYDPTARITRMKNSEIDHLRLQKGLSSLPKVVPESRDPLSP